jgi:hypothetical protein
MQNNFDSISGDDFLTSSDMYMNMNQDPGYYSSPALNEVDNSASSLSLESHSSSPTARMVRSNIPPSLLIGGSASPQEFAAMPSPYMESPYTADPYTSDMTTLMEMHELNSSLPSSPFFTTSFFGTMDTSSVSQLTPPEYSPSEKASAYTSALAYPYSSYTSGDKTPTSPSSFSSPYNYPNGNDNNATPVFPDQQTIKRAMDAAANGAKTFICEFTGCSRTFQQFQNLKSHWRCHSEVKRFGCDECDARFRRLPDLYRHKRSLHGAGKPHECDLCHKTFARADALRRHTLSKNKPRGCTGVDVRQPNGLHLV